MKTTTCLELTGEDCTRNALTGYCYRCETYRCAACEMEVVATEGARCEHCADSDGVPLPVSDDDTSAVKTVRIKDQSTDQLAAEWIARIGLREAA